MINRSIRPDENNSLKQSNKTSTGYWSLFVSGWYSSRPHEKLYEPSGVQGKPAIRVPISSNIVLKDHKVQLFFSRVWAKTDSLLVGAQLARSYLTSHRQESVRHYPNFYSGHMNTSPANDLEALSLHRLKPRDIAVGRALCYSIHS